MSNTTEAPALQVEALTQQLRILTTAVQMLCTQSGTRLNVQQLADRLGVHRNTVTARLKTDRTMPRPGKDGKWLLSEIIEWEQRQHQH